MKRAMIVVLLLLLCSCYSTEVKAEIEGWKASSIPSGKITSLESVDFGVFAGEFDQRVWSEPYNGIYISKDNGKSWEESGLTEKGITDIDYDSGTVLATAYYFSEDPPGLFISKDKGASWVHSGPEVSALSVSSMNGTIFLGTYSHGLWISPDGGKTWEQKIGAGYYGPKVYNIEFESGQVLALLENSTLISYDYGTTWTEVNDLNDLKVRSVAELKGVLFAGTAASSGIHKSHDGGNSWEKLGSWGNYPARSLLSYKNSIFASKTDAEAGTSDILVSNDNGSSWESTGLSIPAAEGVITDMSWVFMPKDRLFASSANSGVYEYEIPKNSVPSLPILSPPWNIASESEVVENIYSYFDHEYPLNSYPYRNEPPEANNTTLNYLGQRGTEPHMYYSGHDGYDFTQPYGTAVIAAASGYATYKNISGGNAILIDHQNGYRSLYLHLQNSGLLLDNEDESVWVDTGEVLGLVGLTGITTGPHIHFAIQRDLDDDGNFADNGPDGNIDPFAWQSDELVDPWTQYTWSDINGTHNGSESLYLWNFDIPETAKYIDSIDRQASLENLKIEFPEDSLEYNITVTIEPYPQPRFPLEDNKLTYITGTSYLLNAYNNLGEKPPAYLQPAKIEIDLSNANLDDILTNSLSIYYWDEENMKWEKVPSVYNLIENKIYGEVYHFSHFAVLGESFNPNGWQDKANINGASFRVIGQ